ncbi:hypothetical protein V6N13_009608 [Hibiscus sabdariffa]|uniref:Uncharacterized protein n=1 Tax=Hibiscus sabdariffa TaxID=183260 RepID=A0ABR2NNK6_9ROSI
MLPWSSYRVSKKEVTMANTPTPSMNSQQKKIGSIEFPRSVIEQYEAFGMGCVGKMNGCKILMTSRMSGVLHPYN